MPPRTALVVGNGLTISLMQHGLPGLRDTWPPDKPLSWDVRLADGRTLPTCLPGFFHEVRAVRDVEPGLSDFDLIDRVTAIAEERITGALAQPPEPNHNSGFEASKLEAEGRHFLGLAYSAYDLMFRKTQMAGWHWDSFLRGLGQQLMAIMSFNYDTVIEHVLADAGINFFHCGVEPPNGIPVGKPHGSINYATPQSAISAELAYPLVKVVSWNDTPVEILPDNEPIQPKLDFVVVPPLAATKIRSFQWVQPIFDAFVKLAPTIERCVFIGLSAWPVDQPELCEVLAALTPGTEVVIANPDRGVVTIFENLALQHGFSSVSHWPNGPDSAMSRNSPNVETR